MTIHHTPGPWNVDGPTLKGNGYNIGSVNSHRTTEGMANACLIAAAPDLIAALIIASISIHEFWPNSPCLKEIDAAIEKATKP